VRAKAQEVITALVRENGHLKRQISMLQVQVNAKASVVEQQRAAMSQWAAYGQGRECAAAADARLHDARRKFAQWSAALAKAVSELCGARQAKAQLQAQLDQGDADLREVCAAAAEAESASSRAAEVGDLRARSERIRARVKAKTERFAAELVELSSILEGARAELSEAEASRDEQIGRVGELEGAIERATEVRDEAAGRAAAMERRVEELEGRLQERNSAKAGLEAAIVELQQESVRMLARANALRAERARLFRKKSHYARRMEEATQRFLQTKDRIERERERVIRERVSEGAARKREAEQAAAGVAAEISAVRAEIGVAERRVAAAEAEMAVERATHDEARRRLQAMIRSLEAVLHTMVPGSASRDQSRDSSE
jgi:predicted nuclease with TOPRIM domain